MSIKNNVIYRICVLTLFLITGLFIWGWIHLPDIHFVSVPFGVGEIETLGHMKFSIPAKSWDVFSYTDKIKTVIHSNALQSQFRLAGTFFSFNDGDETHRIAIIDDLKSNKQKLLSENEVLLGYTIRSIERDRVVLCKDSKTEVLTLHFSQRDHALPGHQDKRKGGVPAGEIILAENQFGKQIAENRWMLKREALMGYYNELLDDPERIAKIYISLAPDYNDRHKIEGYNLNMVGEQDFFNAVGLKEGDVIRKVNSMRMTSQARGEYFLKEFVNERLNAVVIDIERDNVPKKMIYLLR